MVPRPGLKANVTFLGQLPELDRTGSGESSDYRPVPDTDRGNATYRDRGMLGDYATNGGRPFDPPADVRFSSGYGADEADLKRGYQEPAIRDNPAYDLDNYKDRSSQPMLSDLDEDGDAMANDYAFRRRDERSRGFLTRPRVPTDR